MPETLGNISLNLHTVDRDETIYARADNTVSHIDQVALRRTLPSKKAGDTMRTQVRFERGFVANVDGSEKSVTVSIAVTVPPGVVTADVTTFVAEALTQAATVSSTMAISGDIHL